MGEFASKGLANGLGIPALVLGSLGFLNSGGLGGLGGLLGGGYAANGLAVSALQNNGYLSALAAKDAEISELKAEKYTDNKVAALNLELTQQIHAVAGDLATLSLNNERRIGTLESQVSTLAQTTNQGIAALSATVQSITKLVVPGTAVCPEYMPRYNSWMDPTTTTTAAGS